MADQQELSQIYSQAEYDPPASQKLSQLYVQVEFSDPPQGQRVSQIYAQVEYEPVPISQSLIQVPTGGIVFGGHVVSNNSFDFITQTPAGGIVFGGSLSETGFHLNVKTVVPIGGIVFGGSSPISTAPAWGIIVPSGGIVFGGSAPFCGYTDQGKLLVEITLNGIVNRVSTEGHALTHNWRPRIINIGGPTYSIPSDHGGFAKMVFGNVTFNPELFRYYWPPPISCHIEFYYTDTTEEARELIFKGTAHIYSYDRVGITYAIYGPIYDDLVPDSTVYSGSLNDTITSILTLIPEITEVNTLLARDPSPMVNYTSTGDNVLAINLASEIAEFFTHLFYIIGTTAYLVDMGADNGTKDLTNEFRYLAYPKYKHKSPMAVLSAGEFSQSSDYPYGSESSVTPYTDVQADIETALANIIEIENAPRINFDAPMIHRNFLLHGQRVSLFDSANVVDLYSWMRVRKIQYDFNQWKINFEGEGAILSGDEFSGEPFCLKLVAETESLSVTPSYKIVYHDDKIYALASAGISGNAHGYIIDAVTMETLSTIDYGSDIDSFGNGPFSWSDALGRFICLGKRGAHYYVFEFDENLAIAKKSFTGSVVRGTDGQIYGWMGPSLTYNIASFLPTTGTMWSNVFALLDADADYGPLIVPGNLAQASGGGVAYLNGTYLIARDTSDFFAKSQIINRTTLATISLFENGARLPIAFGDKFYAVGDSKLMELDPTVTPDPLVRHLDIGGAIYMIKPYGYGNSIYFSYTIYPAYSTHYISRVDLDTLTIVATNDDFEPYECIMGNDGRLYVEHEENNFVVLDPTDLTFICLYSLHGSRGLCRDDVRYFYGTETNSGKVQKYLPGGYGDMI